jgi:DNA-binding NarL/FixJ family response regulator
MSKEAPTVLIADDQGIILEGLQLILERGGINVVGWAKTGKEAVQKTVEIEPDIVILDIRMPEMDGLEALAAIKSIRPETTVLVITSFANPEYLYRAIILGAAGFLSKNTEPSQIASVVNTVSQGESVIDRQLLRDSLKALRTEVRSSASRQDSDIPSLTEREIRILTLIAEGLTNADIAEALVVSQNTVKTHIRNIYSKIGLSDRTQAAIWAIRHGLVA